MIIGLFFSILRIINPMLSMEKITINKKRYKINYLIFLGFFAITFFMNHQILHAQNSDFRSQLVQNESKNIQKTGMIVLGSWATLNILTGSFGFYSSENDRKYFHQMNAAWNLVNLGIAGFGYRGASTIDANQSYSAALDDVHNFEKILLINAGLDILYIGTGAWLWKNGVSTNSERKIGYGRSIILQGGFLLAFDLVLYAIHNKHTAQLLQVSEHLSFNGNGFIFSF